MIPDTIISPSLTQSERDELHRRHMVSAYSLLSSLVLIVYDLLLTSHKTYVYVWQRKFTFPTLLLLLVQLSCFATLLSSSLLFLGPQTRQLCYAFLHFRTVSTVAGVLFSQLFSVLRVWAIGGQKLLPTLITLVIALFAPATEAYLDYTYRILPQTVNLPPPYGGCVYNFIINNQDRERLLAAVQISCILTDAMVLLITWKQSINARRDARRVGMNSSYAELLIRDGSLYFVPLLVVNVVALGVAQTDLVLLSPAFYFPYTFYSIFTTRFVLSLRSHQTTGSSPKPFMENVVGDLGEQLDSRNDYNERDSFGRPPRALRRSVSRTITFTYCEDDTGESDDVPLEEVSRKSRDME